MAFWISKGVSNQSDSINQSNQSISDLAIFLDIMGFVPHGNTNTAQKTSKVDTAFQLRVSNIMNG